MDSAINAASARQSAVGGVDEDIGSKGGYISPNRCNLSALSSVSEVGNLHSSPLLLVGTARHKAGTQSGA